MYCSADKKEYSFFGCELLRLAYGVLLKPVSTEIMCTCIPGQNGRQIYCPTIISTNRPHGILIPIRSGHTTEHFDFQCVCTLKSAMEGFEVVKSLCCLSQAPPIYPDKLPGCKLLSSIMDYILILRYEFHEYLYIFEINSI